MRTPEALETLVEYGIIEEVLRPLMSGKEAQIYLVISGGERRVAKVYKEAQDRSFKQRAEYTEGRKSRNSRDARAMAKHSRHGKAQDEAAWRSAEVNAIYRLSSAGVRVPTPYHFVDGVLVMELVTDAHGDPAPRLGDLQFEAAGAREVYEHLITQVVRMLCAGVVHGDLSEFNVLMGADGPVIIDFPQAVDPASNASARKLLIRDVDNLHRFVARFVRGGRALPYAQEMWDLYQANLLTPETPLRGRHAASQRPTNTADVLAIIGDAERDHRRKQAREQNPGGRPPAAGPQQGQRAPQGPRAPDPQQARGPQTPAPRGPRGPKVEVQMTPPDARGRVTRAPAGPPAPRQAERAPINDTRASRAPTNDGRASHAPIHEGRVSRAPTNDGRASHAPMNDARVSRAPANDARPERTPANDARASHAPAAPQHSPAPDSATDQAPRKRRRRRPRSGAASSGSPG